MFKLLEKVKNIPPNSKIIKKAGTYEYTLLRGLVYYDLNKGKNQVCSEDRFFISDGFHINEIDPEWEVVWLLTKEALASLVNE